MLVRSKTHAWFMGHRTIVHWRLNHCSMVIEQWCVGTCTIVRWKMKNASIAGGVKWQEKPTTLSLSAWRFSSLSKDNLHQDMDRHRHASIDDRQFIHQDIITIPSFFMPSILMTIGLSKRTCRTCSVSSTAGIALSTS